MKRLLFLLLLPLGCANARPPLETKWARATIGEATSLGAGKVPTARQHLQRAAEQLELAQQLDRKDDPRAVLTFERAQADADLALALAKEAAARRETLRLAKELTR